MFDKFGEFDSYKEINRAAAAQLKEGDYEAIIAIALENGIDKEEAEDFIDGIVEELVNSSMAAVGKIKVEAEALKLEGILLDWKSTIEELGIEQEEIAIAIRKKGKSLIDCFATLIAFAFENKVLVPDTITKATKVKHNGKLEQMRAPLYLGIPNKAEVKKLVQTYYLGGDA